MEFSSSDVASKTTGDLNTARDGPCTTPNIKGSSSGAPAASSGYNTTISASNSCGTGLSTSFTG